MKKDIYIFGFSGYACETACIINELDKYTIKAFVSREKTEKKVEVEGEFFPIITEKEFLDICTQAEVNAVVSIANAGIVERIVNTFRGKCSFPNIVANNVREKGLKAIGEGNIISWNNIFTHNVEIGSFNRFNIGCVIGHDVHIGDNNHFNPFCNISGVVKIENNNLFGVKATVLQGIEIGKGNVIGANSLVIKKIKEEGTYVGVPAKKISF